MSNSEVTAGIVQAVVKARGEVLSQGSNKAQALEQYLSDEAVANLYRAVYKAVQED
ncbi:hypothetical protein [Paenibacillus sp. PDC88]|uniref:hypothetical protein n=1 Tax=Paenibacillus sp. PDC88 TaxID=1884375 RepID=UPI0008941E92|nr:hypothetical protein [Paenibacillus sp. PDC88]SDW30882.1 hypothetical protein SAMN05518848_101959 [Paenibacillus sp. PDC88]